MLQQIYFSSIFHLFYLNHYFFTIINFLDILLLPFLLFCLFSLINSIYHYIFIITVASFINICSE